MESWEIGNTYLLVLTSMMKTAYGEKNEIRTATVTGQTQTHLNFLDHRGEVRTILLTEIKETKLLRVGEHGK